jgi:hypothetical protein
MNAWESKVNEPNRTFAVENATLEFPERRSNGNIFRVKRRAYILNDQELTMMYFATNDNAMMSITTINTWK